MYKLINYVNKGLAGFTILLSTALVSCVIWQVLSRYLIGQPSTITDELARYLFIWAALIGAAYTTGLKRHLAIDLLTMSLSGKKKLINELLIQIAIATFSFFILVYGGTNLALKTLSTGQLTPALGWEMGYIYLCLPISGLLMIFYSIVYSIEKIQQLISRDVTITAAQEN